MSLINNDSYGRRNKLVYTLAGGVHWIFGRFLALYRYIRGRERSHWIRNTFEIQNAWFSAREVEYGSSFDIFSWFLICSEKWRRLSGPVFTVFSAWSSQKTISECFGRNQKDGRQKLCRFVVVSPREVPYSTFSCPFKIFNFRSFSKVPPHSPVSIPGE